MSPSPQEPWTATAARVLGRAPEVARALRHHVAGPDHLLLALLQEGGARGRRALETLGTEPGKASAAVREYLRPGEDPPARTPPFSPLARRALAQAAARAAEEGRRADTGDLLLVLLAAEGSPLVRALAGLGCSREGILGALAAVEKET
ncbi:MAG: Clp protease N-terminal domain-containing protein, partial [Planctomycetota bacterium]